MSTFEIFHLNSFQDRQVTSREATNPFAGFSLRTKKHEAQAVLTYWWHQIGYVLCPEDD
ncbi:MAG: hypothetical protein RBT01_14735 [Anaerolineaceae bacterium]|jgi:hypothetical protein|nr:hypothetical protein [Anaerolineaceae bacterium]